MKYAIFTSFLCAVCFVFGMFMKDKLLGLYKKILGNFINFVTKIKGDPCTLR